MSYAEWGGRFDFATNNKRQKKGRRSPMRGRVLVPHVMKGGQEHKSCAGCGRLRPLPEFSADAKKWDGLNSTCRDCVQERYQESKKP